ncbi:MAG TPA: UDP-N-acetylmuramoyl-L-alanyl-D-glutamate--2,6-diaminopimelate ligase [Methylococcus sp.]|nr:UDP-N-acetylmuramoyl-L-alanyl-D-glutamate--2,6-diaminopimelate ligase [Methylococcus sp.]
MKPGAAGSGYPLQRLLGGMSPVEIRTETRVFGLSLDSRRVRPGDAFVALAGQRGHGLQHVEEAWSRGAVVVLYDPAQKGDALLGELQEHRAGRYIPVPNLGQRLGFIADRFFGEPSRFLTFIAVTGTNGKTSCTHFIAESLRRHVATAVVGTLGWGTPGRLRWASHTTPDAIAIHAILAVLKGEGCELVAAEASSHGLVQGRLNGIRCEGVLYTRITRDHLDYHGSFEAYLEAKASILAHPGLEFAVFNLDDPQVGCLLGRKPVAVRAIGYSLAGHAANELPVVRAECMEREPNGIRLTACLGSERAEVQAPVFGDFNAENLLGTLAVLVALGHPLAAAAELVARVKAVPGRMEIIPGAGVTAVIDYAHTPDALRNLLRSVRYHCQGQLWVVFGCGGNRDRGKRPEMGAIACALADRVVLTDDNPRFEDGEMIIADILKGCPTGAAMVIRDRCRAIKEAICAARERDVVVVAGKGHETTQEVGGEVRKFSDRDAILSAFEIRKRGYSTV